jgi:hypothetical protein
MKLKRVLFDCTIASGLALNVVAAGATEAEGNRTISYVPVPGHATGTLSGDVPLAQLGDYKLSQGEVRFDGNQITITSNTSASGKSLTLTGLVVSPELTVHGKEVKYTSGVYFSRPTVAALPTAPLAEISKPQQAEQSFMVEKVNSHAVMVLSQPQVTERLQLRDGTEITGTIQKISNQAVTILTKLGSKKVPLENVTNIESPKMFVATVVGHTKESLEPGAPFQLQATKIELRPAEEEKKRRRKGAGWLGSGSSDELDAAAAAASAGAAQKQKLPGAKVGPGATAGTLPLNRPISAVTTGDANSLNGRLFSYMPVAGRATGSLSGDSPLGQLGEHKLTSGLVNFAGDKITINSRTADPNRPMVLSGLVLSPELSVHGKNIKYSSAVYFERPNLAANSDAPIPATIETLYLKDGSDVSGTIQKISRQSVVILTKAGTRKISLSMVLRVESPRMFEAIVEGQANETIEQGAPFELRTTKIVIRPFEEDRHKRKGGGGWIVASGAVGIGATAGVPTVSSVIPGSAGAEAVIPKTMIGYVPMAGHTTGGLSGDLPLNRIGDQKVSQASLHFDGNKITVKSGTNALGQAKSLTGYMVSPALTVDGDVVKYSSGVYFSLPNAAAAPDGSSAHVQEKLHLRNGSTVYGQIQKISAQGVTILTKNGLQIVSLDKVTQIDSPKMYATTVEGRATSAATLKSAFQLSATKVELYPVTEDRRRKRGAGWIVGSGALGIAVAGVVPTTVSGVVPVTGGVGAEIPPTVVGYVPIPGHTT